MEFKLFILNQYIIDSINMDFIELYNHLDNIQRKSFHTERLIFSPVFHLKANDPTIISSKDELPYFACTQQDGRAKETVDFILKGLTKHEFEILKR